MARDKRERNVIIGMYLITAYIVLQLIWWGYSLLDAHKHHIESVHPIADQEAMIAKKVWMVVGEGMAFFIIFVPSFIWIQRAIIRELRRARMEKTFLLSVTHELKTPVAAIRLFLETLKTRKLEEHQRAQIVNDALKETDRLQNMSDNILLATRFDHKDSSSLSESVQISGLLRSLINRLSKSESHVWEVEVGEEIMVHGDHELIRALCVNLLENAMKYSPSGKTIHVKLIEEASHIVLTISDEGPGVKDEEKKRIFEKFYRSGDENTRKHKGTGLGLYIACNVARMHKARIEVRDNQPTGSIFVVTFLK